MWTLAFGHHEDRTSTHGMPRRVRPRWQHSQRAGAGRELHCFFPVNNQTETRPKSATRKCRGIADLIPSTRTRSHPASGGAGSCPSSRTSAKPCPNGSASVTAPDETPRAALKMIREIYSNTRHLSRWRYPAPRNSLTVGHCGNPGGLRHRLNPSLRGPRNDDRSRERSINLPCERRKSLDRQRLVRSSDRSTEGLARTSRG
jgi:hypothetical protein